MDDSTAPAALEAFARLLRLASQELDRAVATHLGESSVGRWHVLTAVAAGGGRSMSQLAEATLLSGASLTRLIDAMIADALVHRRVDDTDRRRVLVFPTRRGQLAHRSMTTALDGSGLVGVAGDHARLTRSLTTLVDRLHPTERART